MLEAQGTPSAAHSQIWSRKEQWSKRSPKELAAYPGGGGAAKAVSVESRLQARYCYQTPALPLLAHIFTNQLLH